MPGGEVAGWAHTSCMHDAPARATATTAAVSLGRVIAARIMPPRIGRKTKRARFRAATLFSTALLAQNAFVFCIHLTEHMAANSVGL